MKRIVLLLLLTIVGTGAFAGTWYAGCQNGYGYVAEYNSQGQMIQIHMKINPYCTSDWNVRIVGLGAPVAPNGESTDPNSENFINSVLQSSNHVANPSSEWIAFFETLPTSDAGTSYVCTCNVSSYASEALR